MVDLVSRDPEGLDKLTLLAVNKDSLVSVLYSLFRVGGTAYKDGPSKLFTIRGNIPAIGLPTIVRL